MGRKRISILLTAVLLMTCFNAGAETETVGDTITIEQLEIAEPEIPPKKQKPYRLYLKLGYQYDDNVGLDPLDSDVSSEESDSLMEGFFFGRYHIINQERFTAGAGYSHYQTLHDDFDEYDITGSMGRIYAQYHLSSLTFGLTYFPGYFWVNADSYLRRHQFRPEILWKASPDLYTKLAYTYYDSHYFKETDQDRDGHMNEGFLEVGYRLFDKHLLLNTRLFYVSNCAAASDESYDQAGIRLGAYAILPWELKLSAGGRYHNRDYDADTLGEERKDDKFTADVSLTRKIYFDWLSAVAEYEFTRNNSNMDQYEYDRNKATLSFALRF